MLISKEIISLDEKYNKYIKDIWIFDSGSTSHMTNNINGLYKVENFREDLICNK